MNDKIVGGKRKRGTDCRFQLHISAETHRQLTDSEQSRDPSSTLLLYR